MSDSKPREISDWIRNTHRQAPERVLIRTRHIERDRIWRDINESDVRKVLASGSLHTVRSSDRTVFWRGIDSTGREIELQCGIVSASGADTLVVQEAKLLRIGTAYDPHQDDNKLKKEWLSEHPEYEELPNGKVQRRMTVTKI
jgi:hypothetical protein